MIATATKTETREVTIYTTSDGREFRNLDFAEAHEKEIAYEIHKINFKFTGEIYARVRVPRNASPEELEACVRQYFIENIACEDDIDCNLGDDLEDARNVICTGFTDITKA